MTGGGGAGGGLGDRSSRAFDVLGIGDADVDIYVKVPRLPRRGEKVAGEHLGLHPGGVVANFCAATARLGLSTRLVSAVGDDFFGELTVDDLRARDVDVGGVRVLESAPTYLCLIALDPSGDKALTIARTPAMFPSLEQVTDDELRSARHVHLAPFDLPNAIAVAERARAVGTTVSVDLEPTSTAGGDALLADLVALTDVLLPNSLLIEAWLGEPATPSVARRLVEMGPGLVAIGCGGAGAVLADRQDALAVPAFAVEVRDTTGAGDQFNAAVVCGWQEGWALPQLARFATAAAAHVVAVVGARRGQPTRVMVEQLLADQGIG